MSEPNKTLDFEKQIAELEALVAKLERGDLSLEDSLETYERGMKLANECQQTLNRAEARIALITEKNGESIEEPYQRPSSDRSAQ